MAAAPEVSVEYTHLGNSGLKVSNICLGAMTFGKLEDSPLNIFSCPTQADEEKSHSIMDKFVELGGNFIDTANIYCRGQSEQIIGTWLKKKKRDDVVIATKVRFQMGPEPNSVGLSRRHIIKSCEDSLERLQTDYIDLYQTHLWDDATPIEETLRTLDDLVRCGKVRYLGASNVIGWQTQKIADYTKFMGLSKFISLQQQYSLMVRHPELEEFQVCKTEGLGVLPWSPLKSGMLTGKYKRDEKMDPASGRLAHDVSKSKDESASYWKKNANEKYWALMDEVDKVSKKNDKTNAQVALRWLLQKDVVSSVIIGATSTKQLEENMSVGKGWSLSKEDMEALDEASKPESVYPYEMSRFANTSRINRYHPKPHVQNLY